MYFELVKRLTQILEKEGGVEQVKRMAKQVGMQQIQLIVDMRQAPEIVAKEIAAKAAIRGPAFQEQLCKILQRDVRSHA